MSSQQEASSLQEGIKVHSKTTLVRPMKTSKISEKYGLFSEARSSARGGPISNWTTHVGPSAHGPNIVKLL